ncbi:MAG: EamA family transporter [bacterium]|nr:EamA family transporter [bacterium]
MIAGASLPFVLASAFLHPLWNMLLKRSEDKIVFYLNIHLVFTLLFSFLLYLYPLGDITATGWMLVILSSCSHFFYQLFLCKTYEAGDMSLTYPVVRSSPVFVLVLALVFLHEIPTTAAVIGAILVVAGAYLINQKSLSPRSLMAPFDRHHLAAMAFAVLTAVWSAIYSIVDKKGVLSIPPILFFYLFFACSGFMFLGYFLTLKDRRKKYWRLLKQDAIKITLASILEAASYILILYAFRMSKVAYVVALRQVSVIIGAVYGVVFLKERYGKVRIMASCIIFAGAFCIVAFG